MCLVGLMRYQRVTKMGKKTCAVNADIGALGVFGLCGGRLGCRGGGLVAVGCRGDSQVVVLIINQILVFGGHLDGREWTL